MVSLAPNPALNALCLNDGCSRHQQCARYMTHWDGSVSIIRFAGNDSCAGFVAIPSKARARDTQDDHVLHFRTRSGLVLDRSGE